MRELITELTPKQAHATLQVMAKLNECILVVNDFVKLINDAEVSLQKEKAEAIELEFGNGADHDKAVKANKALKNAKNMPKNVEQAPIVVEKDDIAETENLSAELFSGPEDNPLLDFGENIL